MQEVAEEREKRERDAFQAVTLKLLESRTVIVADEINKRLAHRVMAELLLLDREDPQKEITVLINSHGGDADAAFAIYDIIRFIRPPVKIVCAGLVASAAVVILLAGKKENRLTLPNSRFLIHQPSTGVIGTAADIEIEASEILKFRDKIDRLIATETGQTFEKVQSDTKRNFWMSAQDAVQYGLVDRIITNTTEI